MDVYVKREKVVFVNKSMFLEVWMLILLHPEALMALAL